LQLLAFAGDDAAAAASVKMARAAATLGMSSQLEIGDQSALACLRAACAVIGSPVPGSAMVDLRADTVISTELSGLSATVRLRAIDPGKPEVRSARGATLLVVSSGFATSAELARAALAASDAGSHLAGVVLANPDIDDHTSGLLPELSEPLGSRAPSLNGHVTPELVGGEAT
jgi:hypothetical protein